MKQAEIFQRIRTAIYAEFNHLPTDFEIIDETIWKELELDSIDKLNIIMALEYIFNIQIPDTIFDRFFDGTIKDSVKIMKELLKSFE